MWPRSHGNRLPFFATMTAMTGIGPRRRPTITDVATAAGVAASTVSRAFTRPGRVNADTREHVLSVAAELGYYPNPVARALESGRTNTLALVVPDIANPFFAGLIKGAESVASASGQVLVLVDSQESATVEEHLIRRLEPSVDGFVLAASRLRAERLAEFAASTSFVLVNGVARGIASVLADYDDGTRQIVAHLSANGHESLLFLAGPVGSWSGARRWRGLQHAGARVGMTTRRFGPHPPTLAAGLKAATAAIDSGATAVVCHNDLLAIGVLRGLLARGVAVPGEVSVVGFDNTVSSELCSPTLTTLAEPSADAGAQAVLTLRKIAYERVAQPPTILLATKLMLRDSTGPARLDGAARGTGRSPVPQPGAR